MSDTRTPSVEWHLEQSQPNHILDYFTPGRGFSRQINTLISRFRSVQALCTCTCTPPEALVHLRDALAFHMVRMSRWWSFDFCPRALAGVRNPLFMTYVKAHTTRHVDDDVLLDLFTLQHHMHRGDAGHILALGRDPDSGADLVLLYGIDGQRGFRFAAKKPGMEPDWYRHAYPDYASAWLAAWTIHCSQREQCDAMDEHLAAEREHTWARSWHQRHFHRTESRPAITLYREAMTQRSLCQSRFGVGEFDDIVNGLAFRVVRTAYERHASLATIVNESAIAHDDGTLADTLAQKARLYVTECMDVLQHPELDRVIARTAGCAPRRCS
ncbi:hypothetical protein AA103196_2203 [Ameyamaea chiangmaiensis NBRC 103196]|uniref:Uncharacterized protein n=1 Tax=Ameyamaea chiangmaiensis TaxID=442969 RepID=A0A850PBI2_9PROT|nr:hypothetical protein [Ameyamaea chiangmaiensis]MBS4075537.1 hypothetical protein [Ameyamaea chiangmaiensis]NVN41308.1 hypothetical protein [Ameyamaea chiangmaiensis]GBQ69394.1 hypothetical protein AA103196_2203 [Ameyamaea chiangmaiensis NBRC 103196]